MMKCDVVELMQLQIDRMSREENRLRAELDSIQHELSAVKVSKLQLQSEV